LSLNREEQRRSLTSGAYKPQTGERLGVIITGGNTTAVDFDH